MLMYLQHPKVMWNSAIVMQLRLNNGGEMLINDVTSMWFMNNYMFKERLGAHIRASYFSDPVSYTHLTLPTIYSV